MIKMKYRKKDCECILNRLFLIEHMLNGLCHETDGH